MKRTIRITRLWREAPEKMTEHTCETTMAIGHLVRMEHRLTQADFVTAEVVG